jgi:hypothetical protein
MAVQGLLERALIRLLILLNELACIEVQVLIFLPFLINNEVVYLGTI